MNKIKVFLCGLIESDWRSHLKELVNRTDIEFIDTYTEVWNPSHIFDELILLKKCHIAVVYRPSNYTKKVMEFMDAYNIKYLEFQSLIDICKFLNKFDKGIFNKDKEGFIKSSKDKFKTKSIQELIDQEKSDQLMKEVWKDEEDIRNRKYKKKRKKDE